MGRKAVFALCATILAGSLPVAGAIAQDGEQASVETRAAILVTAPRSRQTDTSYTGVPIETLTAQSIVYIDDLDLSTEAGTDELNDRIEVAAKTACDWLDEVYPLSEPQDSGDCERDAVKRAREQVDVALAGYGP